MIWINNTNKTPTDIDTIIKNCCDESEDKIITSQMAVKFWELNNNYLTLGYSCLFRCR